MSLYKRGNVYWSAIWIDGVRTMRSLETSNRRRAEVLEQRVRDELHTKRFQLPNLNPEMPFNELYARFLADGDVRPYHIERGNQFLSYFTGIPIGRITKNDIVRYRKARQDEYLHHRPEGSKPLSETTLNRDVEVIRHLLYWAVDEGLLAVNPIARIRMVRERGRRRPVISVADEVTLLAACSDHLRPIVIAALDTGLRKGELLQQRAEDVDFDRNLISVTCSKTPEGEHRLVPMTGRVAEALSALKKRAGELFTYGGEPIGAIKTAWHGALRRSSVPRMRFHDLRHSFNSRLADIGVIADIRRALMGHSSGGDVNSIYTHIEISALREAIHRLETWHTQKLKALEKASQLPPNTNLPTEGINQ